MNIPAGSNLCSIISRTFESAAGYAHATWDAMRRAIDSLQYPPVEHIFESKSSKSRANGEENETEVREAKAG